MYISANKVNNTHSYTNGGDASHQVPAQLGCSLGGSEGDRDLNQGLTVADTVPFVTSQGCAIYKNWNTPLRMHRQPFLNQIRD